MEVNSLGTAITVTFNICFPDYFCFLKPRWRQIYRARHLKTKRLVTIMSFQGTKVKNFYVVSYELLLKRSSLWIKPKTC